MLPAVVDWYLGAYVLACFVHSQLLDRGMSEGQVSSHNCTTESGVFLNWIYVTRVEADWHIPGMSVYVLGSLRSGGSALLRTLRHSVQHGGVLCHVRGALAMSPSFLLENFFPHLQVRRWRQLIDSQQSIQNRESEDWLDNHTQPCPQCSAKVQRSGGCNHMVCTVCGQHFCYACGGDWCAFTHDIRCQKWPIPPLMKLFHENWLRPLLWPLVHGVITFCTGSSRSHIRDRVISTCHSVITLQCPVAAIIFPTWHGKPGLCTQQVSWHQLSVICFQVASWAEIRRVLCLHPS